MVSVKKHLKLLMCELRLILHDLPHPLAREQALKDNQHWGGQEISWRLRQQLGEDGRDLDLMFDHRGNRL